MDGTREAEMIVQLSLQGIMYLLRLTGESAKEIANFLIGLSKQPSVSPGVVRMKSLLASREALDYYTIPEGKMKEFVEKAKKYGIQYCVALREDGKFYDIVIKQSDSPRISRIAELLGIGKVKGGIESNVTEAETEQAVKLTPQQEMIADMMSPNKKEREAEPVPGQKLQEEPVSESYYNENGKESVRDNLQRYKTETESAKDMFANGRSVFEKITSDLPDGMEPVVADIGWERPLERYNSDGERLYRGKTAGEMNETDKWQYMVDNEMLEKGKLSDDFLRTMYISGYGVEKNGMAYKMESSLTSREKEMIADMMREPAGEKTIEVGKPAGKMVKEDVK